MSNFYQHHLKVLNHRSKVNSCFRLEAGQDDNRNNSNIKNRKEAKLISMINHWLENLTFSSKHCLLSCPMR